MVTQQELDEAEAAVEVAEQRLDVAEAYHADASSEAAVAELRIARAASHAARDRLRQLRSRYASEQAKGRAREAAEQGFPAKARTALTRRLTAARNEATDAVAAVEQAAAAMLAAVATYDAEVRVAAADLTGRGLRAGDGLDGGSGAGVVSLDGEVWRAADGGALLGAVMQAVVSAVDARHPLAQLRWGQMGGLPEKVARDELLSKAALR